MSDELLAEVFEAHGGLERWKATRQLQFTGWAAGILPWPRPDFLQPTGATFDTHTQRGVLDPFGAPDRRAVFTPEHVDLQDADGHVLASRDRPRSRFAFYPPDRLWDDLDAAYFAGYAFWTYLTVPFLLARTDVRVSEIEPWDEDGETWRRVRLEFPEHLATHSRIETLYFGEDKLLRRHDYDAEVLGGPATAHYTGDYKTFDGFAFPTRRWVLRRNADDTTSGPILINLDIHSVVVS